MGLAIEFESVNHHFYIPIGVKYGVKHLNARFLLDTGASKCSIPFVVNEHVLKLPVQDRDERIQIAGGTANYDVVSLDRMDIIGAELFVERVETWLTDDFILGMNLLSKFKFKIDKGRKLLIES